MNSIRPLVTITILVAVGAYLYVKINEGPARSPAESDKWLDKTPDAAPPLDATAIAPAAPPSTAATAVPWPATAPAAASSPPLANGPGGSGTPSPATVDAAVASAVPSTLPAVPAIPVLPEIPATTDASAQTGVDSVPPPTSLPENIPTARYPDESLPAGVAASPDSTVGTQPQPIDSSDTTAQLNTPPNTTNGTSPAPVAAAQQSTSSQNPLRNAAEQSVNPDRYPSSIYNQGQSAIGPSVPVEPTFAASWPEIKTALDGGELASAHQLLSKWHDDPSLTPAEAQQVATLLSQLAGTVVYSTEHQLEPARVVKPGETLQTIAQDYNVPWQLLAKINGVATADQVRPGQELKVVRGPFSAVVNLSRKQLTLSVDGRYAGTFPAIASVVLPVSEGEWIVTSQSANPRAVVLARPDAPSTATQKESTFLGPASLEKLGVPVVCLSDADTNEVSDILSVGSRVTIRR